MVFSVLASSGGDFGLYAAGRRKSGCADFRLNCNLDGVDRLKRYVARSKYNGKNIAIGLGIAITMLFISMRVYVLRKSKNTRPGSVANLVHRGQLRSDRKGIKNKFSIDMETERVVEFPIVNIDKRPRKRQRLGWDMPQVMPMYFYGHEIGIMINVMPSMALSLDIANKINKFSHGLPNVIPGGDSPPWRKDDKDGHYTFAIGDNLTPRFN
ncbi:hypothetical protein QQ045_000066 [Rhodiola kirilowii]